MNATARGPTRFASERTGSRSPEFRDRLLWQVLGVVLALSFCAAPPAWGQTTHFEPPIADCFDPACQPWDWQILPAGLIWHSYLAGPKEPRLGYAWLYDTYSRSWVNDSTLGARVGLLRFGTRDPFEPQGWQLDVEAAAFPRLQAQHLDLNAVDFRAGVPFTWRGGPWQTKIAYYHLSAHVGDEYLLQHPDFQRINYRRDALVFGAGYFAAPDVRLYAEVGYAFITDGGAEPWELQFGGEYAPTHPTGRGGAPFLALNAYLREEVAWGGDFTLMAGWAWRGDRLFRVGLQYTVGAALPWEFLGNSEQLLGVGLWYDF